MKQQQIYLLLFGVMITWGFNVIATKLLVTSFMPVTMTAFRIFTAGLCVFIILFLLKKVRMFTRKEFPYVFFGALLNVVGHHYFLSVGLTKTSATNGGLILGLGPLLTTILSILFLGSTITLIRSMGIILGFTGVSFVVLEGNGSLGHISMGDLYVFLSIFFQASSFVLIKKGSKTLEPRLMTGYMLLIGSLLLFILSLFLEPEGLTNMLSGSLSIWIIFFASAIIATAVGHMLYNFAIGKVGAAEASIFMNLTPFFALIGSALFLGEDIGFGHIAGFILILLGVLLGSGSVEPYYRKIKQNQQNKNAQTL